MSTTIENVPDLKVLEGWARTKDRQGLAKIAEAMPRVTSSDKPSIIAWLLAHESDRLAESRRIEIAGLAYGEQMRRSRYWVTT